MSFFAKQQPFITNESLFDIDNLVYQSTHYNNFHFISNLAKLSTLPGDSPSAKTSSTGMIYHVLCIHYFCTNMVFQILD